MARVDQYRVVDADGHVTETNEQLRNYLDPAYRNRDAFYPTDHWDRSLNGKLGTRAKDAKTWLDAMDRAGVECSILYPTSGLAIGWVREPDFAVALARAYNNFLHEEFLKVNPRLQGVALVPLQDVPEAVKELRRAITELGLAGAMLPAVGARKPLGHEDYWPIYAEAERLGCMLAVHATVRGPHYFAGELFDQFIEVHTLSHPFAQMIQMTSIVFRGVFEQFPTLKIAFMEAGCSWVPYWVERMDEEWELRAEVEAPLCRKKPSEYISSGRVFFEAEGNEALLGQVGKIIGESGLFYASDWPHWDAEFPENIHELVRREDLSPQFKQKILADNARRLYINLPPLD
ncbi:MAG TPA: amidohydrolase family protein [Dehalococcoidia bacterium]|nr:amidohydrolase family protein [Dehalococcoidia bacterium]